MTGAVSYFEVMEPKALQSENQTQRIRSRLWIDRTSRYTQLKIYYMCSNASNTATGRLSPNASSMKSQSETFFSS